MKFKINSIIKHKHCNLKYKIVDYDYTLFGEWVKLKCLYRSSFTEYGKIETYDISILREYKLIKD